MTGHESREAGIVLAGGQGGAGTASAPDSAETVAFGARRLDRLGAIVSRGSAASGRCGGTAADPWPDWVRAQLCSAVEVAAAVPAGESIARALYREWFIPVATGRELSLRARLRPLVGVYRSAHAGSTSHIQRDGLALVDRHDVVGTDGWWRTWGTTWTPPRTRPGSMRLLFTPRPERLAEFVHIVTSAMLPLVQPWTLACATDPRRIRRRAAAFLDVADLAALPERMFDELGPVLRDEVPPLCLPLGPGVALASYPDNGMTFGEHRCHLVALGLRRPGSDREPLREIAAVFAAHGIAPSAPYRCG